MVQIMLRTTSPSMISIARLCLASIAIAAAIALLAPLAHAQRPRAQMAHARTVSPAAAASRRCGVASEQAVFEAPGVQVYFRQLGFNKRAGYRQERLIACVLPAHTMRVVGTIDEIHDGGIQSESYKVNGLIGGRYLWATVVRTSPDAVLFEEQLIDLQTGRQIHEVAGGGAASPGELPFQATVVAPGELVFFEGPQLEQANTLIARFTAGGRKKLDTGEHIQALAAGEHEIYWLNGATVRSAAVPDATTSTSAAAVSFPRSVTALDGAMAGSSGAAIRSTSVGDSAAAKDATALKHTAAAKNTKRDAPKRRCEAPRTRTLYRSQSRLRVLQRQSGQVFACSDTVGKVFALETVLPGVTPTGPPTDIDLAGEGSTLNGVTLSYQFPAQTPSGSATALVVLNPATGAVIRSALAPAGVTDWTYGPAGRSGGTIAYTSAGTLTVVDAAGSRQIDTGTISELAITPLTPPEQGSYELYWMNDGAAKAYSLKTG